MEQEATERQENPAKRLKFIWNLPKKLSTTLWWIAIAWVIVVGLLAQKGHSAAGLVWGVGWALFFSAALSYRLYFFNFKFKLVRQLQSADPLKREQAFKQILKMPRKQAISHFVQALTTPIENSDSVASDLAHALAVEGLGVLKAKEAIPILYETLNHPNPMVRAKAIWALGEIGDPSTISHIIPLLGDASPVKSDQEHLVSRYAADVLSKLGEKKLVKAFDEAMQGQIRKWTKTQLSGKYRPQVVQAFAKALDGDLSIAINAARALGELLLVEAIPDLERKAYSLSTPPELREVCLKALTKLNEFSRLPTIPPASLETANLPRPAIPIEIPTENLPRAASKSGENDRDAQEA